MFKYSVKLLLRTEKERANGHVPIYIRIIISGKSTYISTGHSVPLNMWDERRERVKDGYSLSGTINPDIEARKRTILQRLAEVMIKGETLTAAQAKILFTSGNLNNIFTFVENYRKEVQHKRETGTLVNYEKHLQKLKDFHGSSNLTFEEIDHNLLVRFENYLRAQAKVTGETLGDQYIFAILKSIRAFFNAARKRGVTKHYPFSTYEMPEFTNPRKDYLTLAELDKIEQHADTTNDPTRKQSAIYFLLGCYSGLRVSDWTKFNPAEHIDNGRLRLRAKKNQEWVTMPVLSRLQRNIERIKKVPLTICVHEINRTLKDIAKSCGLSKRLTTHVGRHTFAITMCADQGISAETCAELMGITVATCVENYYKVTNRKIDKETSVWKNL